MVPAISVHEREVGIVTHLSQTENSDLRTIREIWEKLRQPPPAGIGDSASLPTYHRTVLKLVRRGQIEEDTPAPDGSARYKVGSHLSAVNTFTLTDIETALWELSAPQALAAYLDAVDYYESNAGKVLGKAAEGLLKENPVDLIFEMLQDEIQHLKEDFEDLKDPEVAEPQHRRQTEFRIQNLSRFLYGELGLSSKMWCLPSLDQAMAGKSVEPDNWKVILDNLTVHVYGESFVEKIKLEEDGNAKAAIIAGTDGSTHTGYMRGIPAPSYVEDEGRMMLTFNNSVAYVHLPDNHPQKIPFPYHGVPMTRAAIEDPHNRGMIIARPWFPDLTDSQFEHMKKSALDVVQFRVDERLMKGLARAYGTTPAGGGAGMLPKPNVLIRDGTVTPQEREFQHYTDATSYGEVVREGIALSYSILKAVADSEHRVFAGAVKMTVLRTYSRIINWYIKRGSKKQFGKPIDPNWDISRASHVSDAVAVTRLLNALPALGKKEYYRTCVIVRPFTAMATSLRYLQKNTKSEWLEWFEERKLSQVEEWKKHGGDQPWLTDVDLEDDPYVRMCQEAAYGIFYFGRPGGDPHITLPRFEFMDALKKMSPSDQKKRVLHAVHMIMAAVHQTKWHLDKEHNFMSARKLPRLIPYVVYEAHEKCKVLGHKLESELRQAIGMWLSQFKAIRGVPLPKVDIESMSLKSYISKVKDKLHPSGGGADMDSPEGEEEV